jgi:hypothetical protein
MRHSLQQLIACMFILLTMSASVGGNFFKVSTQYSITSEQLEIAKEDYNCSYAMGRIVPSQSPEDRC